MSAVLGDFLFISFSVIGAVSLVLGLWFGPLSWVCGTTRRHSGPLRESSGRGEGRGGFGGLGTKSPSPPISTEVTGVRSSTICFQCAREVPGRIEAGATCPHTVRSVQWN